MAIYNFYIQKYPQDKVVFPVLDIEKQWNCIYKAFSGFFFDGEIKNIYTEDFSEQNGVNVYIPPVEELAYKTYDCTLELLFNKSTVLTDSRNFYEYIRGQKIEYHDTFRNRYVTLLTTKQPSVQDEILYGDRPYMLVNFTFTNIDGITYAESKLK